MTFQSPPSSQVSMWKAALPEIKMLLLAKSEWFIALCLVMTGIHLVSLNAMISFAAIVHEQMPNPQLLKDHPELMPHVSILNQALVFLPAVVMVVSIYWFAILYLQIAAKKSPPQVSWSGFFQWLWNCIKKYFLYFLALFLSMLGTAIICGVLYFLKSPPTLIILIWVLGIVISLVFAIRVYLRFYLVTPMSVLDKKPVLKNSSSLTKNNYWRIFCGAFVFYMMCGFPMALFSFYIMKQPPEGTSHVILGVGAVVLGILSSLFAVINVVYQCTVYRILVRERQAQNSQPILQ